jgi:NAD(P)-dependent dehydrogenase (short-subunit alcohol dehydrogenase family)
MLAGRVAIVSGAGRGLGRAHAIALAAAGAAVVVNDLGTALDGGGRDSAVADAVVAEIVAAGGRAVASGHDVSDWTEAGELVALATRTFGGLHVLVNNAGVLRDQALVNLGEEAWDTVIRVHLKGHAAPTAHAMAYWRSYAKEHGAAAASVIHTTSVAALTGNFGQANYATAKAGLLGLSRSVSVEGARYGVRSNAVSPSAGTRMSADPAGASPRVAELDPAAVSALVVWLAREDCPADSQIFHCMRGRVVTVSPPRPDTVWETEGEWSSDDLDRMLRPSMVAPPSIADFLGFEVGEG